jgi:hypothetical protein
MCHLFGCVLNGFSFKNRKRLQNANITVIFGQNFNFFLEKQLQIKNSGFVKTCDEHVLKDMTMARGMLRWGFWASSPLVAIVSNPTNP